MKRPTLHAILDTLLWLIPWLVVWWGIATGDLWFFFVGALLVIDLGLRRIWRELHSTKDDR